MVANESFSSSEDHRFPSLMIFFNTYKKMANQYFVNGDHHSTGSNSPECVSQGSPSSLSTFAHADKIFSFKFKSRSWLTMERARTFLFATRKWQQALTISWSRIYQRVGVALINSKYFGRGQYRKMPETSLSGIIRRLTSRTLLLPVFSFSSRFARFYGSVRWEAFPSR